MKTTYAISLIALLLSPAALAQVSRTVCDQDNGKIDNITLQSDNSVYVVETDPQTKTSWAATLSPDNAEYAYYYNLYGTGSCPVNIATNVPAN